MIDNYPRASPQSAKPLFSSLKKTNTQKPEIYPTSALFAMPSPVGKPSKKSPPAKPVAVGATQARRQASDSAPKSPRKYDSTDASPRVLIERKELQGLQSERRTLVSRVDDASAENHELRDQIRERDEALAAARVDHSKTLEIAARQEQIRCEERDKARMDAAAAEQRALGAAESRAASEANRIQLQEQLALAHAEARRTSEELIRHSELLTAAQAEGRRIDEGAQKAQHALRDELMRERERAVAAEARVREIEPEREAAHRERASIAERLSGTLAEVSK